MQRRRIDEIFHPLSDHRGDEDCHRAEFRRVDVAANHAATVGPHHHEGVVDLYARPLQPLSQDVIDTGEDGSQFLGFLIFHWPTLTQEGRALKRALFAMAGPQPAGYVVGCRALCAEEGDRPEDQAGP